jgi:hypothetical protein
MASIGVTRPFFLSSVMWAGYTTMVIQALLPKERSKRIIEADTRLES